MRWIVVLGTVALLVDLSLCLVFKNDDPNIDIFSDEEQEVAKEYMDSWMGKGWEDAKKSCDLKKLPATTDAVIFKVCGQDTKTDKCVCNIAKAHSCHVGCRELKPACPAECSDKHCRWGHPVNGGVPLSEGYTGVCHKYCSPVMQGSRFCGIGPEYQSGLFVDCSNCSPLNSRRADSPAGRKEQWTKCMANCFPTPTCEQMCAAGSPQCYSKCVEKYRGVVEPYWDIFKGSLKTVPILTKSLAVPVNHTQIGTNHKEIEDEPVDDVVVEEVIEEVPDEEAAEAVEESPVKEVSEKEHAKDEEVEKIPPPSKDEKVEEIPLKDEKVEKIPPEEEPWEDPWAGENEWDDDDYGEYHLVGVRRLPENHTDLARRTRMNNTMLRRARSNGSVMRRVFGNHTLIRRRLPKGMRFRGDRSLAKNVSGSHMLLRKWRRIRHARENRSNTRSRILRRKFVRRVQGRHSHVADVLRKADALGLT